jgi:selenocysteine-specific elongation factor
MYVICTAGHVDHGKSTLVRVLTGMEPDRLAEEQRRSMTVDLGFAWFDLQDGGQPPRTVAIVDLPGHHRFVANMLAGASSVAVALVVISADDGPMPQTSEHLKILDLLGVRHGIVAVTKTDLVDDATAGIAAELAQEALAGTSLAGAAVVPVSAATGHNMPLLRRRLLELLAGVPAEEDTGRPRLWVDRSFSIRGAGTVVTGTLRQGCLTVGDEVLVLPGGRRARIRGLESLGRPVERAEPGSRVAVNLVGPSRDEVRRGDAIGLRGQWHDVRDMETWVRTFPGQSIPQRGDWHLHCGSGEWRVELVPVSSRSVAAGEEGLIRVRAADPIPVVPGDRFVLRESGRQETVGGGIVLDVAPARQARGKVGRAARAAELASRLEALRAGDRLSLVVSHVRAHGTTELADVPAIAGLSGKASAISCDRRLFQLGGSLVDASQADGWRAAAVEAVRRGHAGRPLDRAVARDVPARAATAAGCPPHLAQLLVGHAVQRGELAAEGPGVRLPGHAVRLDDRQSLAADRLIELLNAGEFAPPDLDEAARESGAEGLIAELEASGRLVKITPDLAVTPATLQRAHELLRAAFGDHGPLSASQARDALGSTRKYVLPLLATLDHLGLTRRVGDSRVVLDAAKPGELSDT